MVFNSCWSQKAHRSIVPKFLVRIDFLVLESEPNIPMFFWEWKKPLGNEQL